MMRVMVSSNSLQLVRLEVDEKDWRGQGRCFGKIHLICDECTLDLTCLLILVAQLLERKRLGMLCRSVFIRGSFTSRPSFGEGISRELSPMER